MKTAGIYIHIPFCFTKCGYCNFYSITSLSSLPDFLRALQKEMEMYHHQFDQPFDTLYIGGGTPSILSLQQLEDILTGVRKNFRLLPNSEITLEANPGDLKKSFIESLAGLGINRLNIGIQSFDQRVLDFLGRRHSSEQAIAAIEISRKAGFDNIGLDLIYGVPGQEIKCWQDTLTRAVSFFPEHISCYQLTIEAETPLGKSYKNSDFALPGEELQYDFFMKTSQWLENAGYIHYEVSNFARETSFASRHNQKYWNHTPYLGLGPAAHSFIANQRWWNHKSLDHYITDIKAGKMPITEREILTEEQLRLEALYLGLRTKKGIHLKDFAEQYHCNLVSEKREILDRLREEGFISIQDGYLRPTLAGLAVADRLALM